MDSWHEEYKRRYKALKESGRPFFPYAVFKDAVAAFLIVCALLAVAYNFKAELEPLADPTDTSYNPRPEWYFLSLFEALKLFPGSLEAVGAVILPGLAFLLLLLVPFLDKGPLRHPVDRPLWTGSGAAVLLVFSYLTWAGYRSPLTNPVEEKAPEVLAGRRLYGQLNCAYCHRIEGKGGKVGPELDKAAATESGVWLARHFRDPQSVTPGSSMPKLNLLEDELLALVAYMKSLGPSEEPYTEQAPELFGQNCAACHRVGKEGGDLGPDLSLIGSARDKAYIRKYILDPSLFNPASTMPGYKGQLTDIQIEDLARYLASLGR